MSFYYLLFCFPVKMSHNLGLRDHFSRSTLKTTYKPKNLREQDYKCLQVGKNPSCSDLSYNSSYREVCDFGRSQSFYIKALPVHPENRRKALWWLSLAGKHPTWDAFITAESFRSFNHRTRMNLFFTTDLTTHGRPLYEQLLEMKWALNTHCRKYTITQAQMQKQGVNRR